MRILIATPLYPPQIGGPAKYAKKLHDEFGRRSIAAPVVVWGRIEQLLPWGLRHLWYFVRLLPHIARAHVVLALDASSVALPALFTAKLFRKKILVRIGGDFLWEMYIERTEEMIKLSEFYTTKRNFSMRERIIYTATKYLARHADILLFNTSWQLGIWQRAYQFDVARAKVMENEYPPKQISAPPMRKKFIAAGRGIRYKNIPAFAAAFAKVKERYPEIELDTRALPPEEHTERITQCFAVVVPSVSEVNSNFIIEALSYGKPFITTRDSGMDERVRGLGMFIDTARESEMEEAIEAMLDPSIYRGYVRHIDEFSYTHSWKEIAEEILKFAREV